MRLRFSRTWHHPDQLEFKFEFAVLSLLAEENKEDDLFDPWSAAPPVHLVVSAASAPRPAVNAPRSIFDAAGCLPQVRLRSTGCEIPRAYKVVHLENGAIRHVHMRIQETEEWAEKEAARRARQRPPKPPKTAKSRSRKLLAMIGEDR